MAAGAGRRTLLAFCSRGGALLAAAWLAYDDVQRLPGWLLFALPVLLIVLVRWPKLLLLLIPLLILCAVVRRAGRQYMGRSFASALTPNLPSHTCVMLTSVTSTL